MRCLCGRRTGRTRPRAPGKPRQRSLAALRIGIGGNSDALTWDGKMFSSDECPSVPRNGQSRCKSVADLHHDAELVQGAPIRHGYRPGRKNAAWAPRCRTPPKRHDSLVAVHGRRLRRTRPRMRWMGHVARSTLFVVAGDVGADRASPQVGAAALVRQCTALVADGADRDWRRRDRRRDLRTAMTIRIGRYHERAPRMARAHCDSRWGRRAPRHAWLRGGEFGPRAARRLSVDDRNRDGA